MARKRGSLLLMLAGVFVFCAIVGLSLGAWFFATAYEGSETTAPAAARAFDDVRARFGDGPVFEIVDRDRARVRRTPPATPAPTQLQHLQILSWHADDQRLIRVTLPFWLLRMKAGPINLASHVHISEGPLAFSVEEVERYGPALLIDHQEDGRDRLLMWTE